jgi:post-segregation antitoxin (ccd killing protein)
MRAGVVGVIVSEASEAQVAAKERKKQHKWWREETMASAI